MTATNIIVQQQAAHLLTDAAYYDRDGVIRKLGPKLVVSEALNMAVAVAQRAFAEQVAPWLDAQVDQEAALRGLPALAAEIKAGNASASADATGDENDVALFAILWSKVRDRAEGWAVCTCQAFFGGGYEPGTLVELESMLVPSVDPVAVLRRGSAFPARFEAVGDGRAILQAQRGSTEFTHGKHLVGGWGSLATVRRGGVSHRVICDWPQDEEGHAIAA
jgi:hypothetical protein